MGTVLSRLREPWLGLNMAPLPRVQSRVEFYKHLDIHQHEKPYYCNFNVGAVANAKRTNVEFEEHDLFVSDIRGFEHRFTLERHGFEVVHHHSSLSGKEFESPKQLEDLYLSECREIIHSRYQGSQVVVFNHRVR